MTIGSIAHHPLYLPYENSHSINLEALIFGKCVCICVLIERSTALAENITNVLYIWK
jgi:hypothetical protein